MSFPCREVSWKPCSGGKTKLLARRPNARFRGTINGPPKEFRRFSARFPILLRIIDYQGSIRLSVSRCRPERSRRRLLLVGGLTFSMVSRRLFSVVFFGRLSRVRKSNSDANWFRAFFHARHHGRQLRVYSGRQMDIAVGAANRTQRSVPLRRCAFLAGAADCFV